MLDGHFTSDHYAVVDLVLGARGTDILTAFQPICDADRTRIDFDAERVEMHFRTADLNNPVVVLHEVAHVYHVLHWRRQSLDAPESRCEAVAVLAELVLAMRAEQFAFEILSRLAVAHSIEAVNIALKAVRNAQPSDELHDLMHQIMEGWHG